MTISRMILGVMVAMVLAVQAQAVPVWGTDATGGATMFSGSRSTSTGGGLIGNSEWDDGNLSVTWTVEFNPITELWTYTYDMVGTRDVSHFILEVTEDNQDFFFTANDTRTEGPKDGWVEDTTSNPGLPNDLYGVKFDFEDDQYVITTDRAPVWGVGYWKDGKTGTGEEVYAYTRALDFSDYKTNMTLTENDFIVRPNGARTDDGGGDDDGGPDGGGPGPGGAVPEPATAMLALMAAPLLMRRRRNA